jgi:hypothetical protein
MDSTRAAGSENLSHMRMHDQADKAPAGSLSTMTARRAKRDNGGLGEDPPGSTMTYKQALRLAILPD